MSARDHRHSVKDNTPAWRLWSVSLDLETVRHLADIAEEIAGEMYGGLDERDRDRIVALQAAIGVMLKAAMYDVDALTAELKEEEHETHS